MNKEAQENLDIINQAADDIKKGFLNLDEQIDKFKDMISPWFVAPKLLTRPLVVGLWGTTGTGKTELVRRFIKQLGLSQMFVSIHCNSQGGYSNLKDKLLSTMEMNGGRAVVLLDEFQNVCTKGSFGARSTNSNSDLWEILSDGKIVFKVRKYELIDRLNSLKERIINGNLKPESPAFRYIYDAIYYMRICKFEGVITPEDALTKVTTKMLVEKLKDTIQRIEELTFNLDFSKVLFIIAGNMDSAFKEATGVTSVEVEADAVYESNKEVTIFDIKRGLSCKLFPEDVARLGNNHIIFYGFSKRDYQRLIVGKINEIVENTEKISGIRLKFDESIYEMVYRNGVFPAQGTRPVFSTIQGMVESNIPKIIFAAAEADKMIEISYDDERHEIVTSTNMRIPCVGSVDEAMLRMDKDKDEKRCTSVHEIGHALVYAELFGAIPSTMVSVVADSAVAAGFISTHLIRHTRVTMENFICTALAGMVAEEVVFGKDFRTVGCCSDLNTATMLAARYTRAYAFSDKIKAVVGNDVNHYNNVGGTSECINEMVKHCAEKTKTIIENNIEILKELSDVMFDNCRCTPQEFKDITDKHGKNYKILSYNAKITPNFRERYKLFCDANAKNISEIANEGAFVSFYPGATVANESSDTSYHFDGGTMSIANENAAMLDDLNFDDVFGG